MSLVHIDQRKWPDKRHWQFEVSRLGEDEHGVWLYAPPSTTAQRGHEPPRRIDAGFVLLVPENESWVAEFYWDHPWHEVYVNIGTVPAWDGDRMHQIDLDLDVVRTLDGSVVVLDEDEFVDHQGRYGYPDHLVAAARTATERVVAMLTAREEPFAAAGLVWLRMAGHGPA